MREPAVARGGLGRRWSLPGLAGLALAGAAAQASGCHGGDGAGSAVTAADLDREVFTSNCAFGSCHGGGAPAAGLDFSRGLCAAMLERPSCLFPDRKLAVPGDPDASFLMHKLLGTDLPDRPATECGTSDARMPLGGVKLVAGQIARVGSWIMAGAPCDLDVLAAGDAGAAAEAGGAADAGGSEGGDETMPPPDVPALALSPPTLRLSAGERSTVVLTLSPPAGQDGATVVIDTSDRDALAVPAAVFLPAGTGQLSFDVLGKRPVPAQLLTASLGAARAQSSITIGGLYLGEIFYGGGAHAQWIKLVNASSVPIDLSGYLLGAGSASYGETVAGLTGLLEAGGCSVVGGPDSTPDNGSPVYDQALDFSPDIPQPAGEVAVGVALFSAPADGAGSPTASVPVDAVVVGPDDPAGLPGSDGAAAIPVAGAVDAGGSLARQSVEAWSVRAAPEPSQCPELVSAAP